MFVEFISKSAGGIRVEISGQTLALVRSYTWPGNIREMKHVTQRAVRLNQTGIIEPDDLMLQVHQPAIAQDTLRASIESSPYMRAEPSEYPFRSVVAAVERDAMIKALEESQYSIEECGRRLGMSRATLYRKLRVHRLTPTRA
jgi:transcriptional regulator of acetoin/glycerol metabolism